MRRFGLFGAVLLALALVYAVAWRTQPRAAQSAVAATGQTAAVTSVARSCPPAPPGTGSARITMIAASAQSFGSAGRTTADGSATLSVIPAAPAATKPNGKRTAPAGKQTAKATAPEQVSTPGTVAALTPPGATAGGGTAVTATGRMAEGFAAEQANTDGMGLVNCTHPGSDMWFVGTGEAAGAADVRLYLMNTGTVTATADVTILTDTGQQNGLANGITVAPNQVVAENVTPFITGSQALALHVQTSSGQVAASVWEGDASGGAWLPQAAEPATTLVIPGLTVASSASRLFVTVPGGNVAKLKVVALTPSGAVTQFASAPVEASAGATTPVSLSSLGASAAALELTSNVPIVASVQVPGSGIGAFTAAAAPVSGQGVVAGNPATTGDTVGLLLTAPAGTATGTITVVGPAGSAASPGSGQVVTVRGGHTLAVAVPRPKGSTGPFGIILTPRAGSGPLYAVRVVTSGTGGLSAPVSSLLPLANAPTAITLPPVDNSYTAVLP